MQSLTALATTVLGMDETRCSPLAAPEHSEDQGAAGRPRSGAPHGPNPRLPGQDRRASYLGPGSGGFDLQIPHTNNVGEVRDFVDNVCTYLDVDVVDVIAHSLGCSLIYAIGRGLERRTPPPVNWGQPKKWHRLGTFVALDGALHGLRPFAQGEWNPNGEFMRELLTETEGGGGETPYAAGKPQTPPPTPHHITYFCAVARGGEIDTQNTGTGRLAGAVIKSYNLGSGWPSHRKIKEDQVVFDDFLPLLNSVPPGPPVKLTVDKDTCLGRADGHRRVRPASPGSDERCGRTSSAGPPPLGPGALSAAPERRSSTLGVGPDLLVRVHAPPRQTPFPGT